MKKLLLTAAVAMLCTAASAQIQIGSPCPKHGEFVTVQQDKSMDTARCERSTWAWFKKGGEKRVLITYSITGNGIHREGTLTTVDGVPSTIAEATDKTYTASVTERDGKPVVERNTVKVGYSMLLAPRLNENGAMTMLVQYSESALSASEPLEIAGVTVLLPQVAQVGIRQEVPMELGKEMEMPIPGVAERRQTHYTLKVVTTVI